MTSGAECNTNMAPMVAVVQAQGEVLASVQEGQHNITTLMNTSTQSILNAICAIPIQPAVFNTVACLPQVSQISPTVTTPELGQNSKSSAQDPKLQRGGTVVTHDVSVTFIHSCEDTCTHTYSHTHIYGKCQHGHVYISHTCTHTFSHTRTNHAHAHAPALLPTQNTQDVANVREMQVQEANRQTQYLEVRMQRSCGARCLK